MNGVPGVENIAVSLEEGVVHIDQTSWTGEQTLITLPIEHLPMLIEALESLVAE